MQRPVVIFICAIPFDVVTSPKTIADANAIANFSFIDRLS
jgi:hypothetical protein